MPLDFHHSTMRAGKSTHLLQRRHDLKLIGRQVAVWTYCGDHRYAVGRITSRMGIHCDANTFSAETVFAAETLVGMDALLIDEAQFLSVDQVKQLRMVCNLTGMQISCFGLRSDFQGNLFPGASGLFSWADNLYEVSTLCQCGAKATLNQRISEDGSPIREGAVIAIGGDNHYRPVCSKCFF